eukprot:COSAG01_NODE_913_length_12779_cov_9.134385_14_plen_174_part_00
MRRPPASVLGDAADGAAAPPAPQASGGAPPSLAGAKKSLGGTGSPSKFSLPWHCQPVSAGSAQYPALQPAGWTDFSLALERPALEQPIIEAPWVWQRPPAFSRMPACHRSMARDYLIGIGSQMLAAGTQFLVANTITTGDLTVVNLKEIASGAQTFVWFEMKRAPSWTGQGRS